MRRRQLHREHLQMSKPDWKNELVQQLNDAEAIHLSKILNDTVVQKYLRAIVYRAMLEQALFPLDLLVAKEDYVTQMAFQKGVISTAEMLLDVELMRPPPQPKIL